MNVFCLFFTSSQLYVFISFLSFAENNRHAERGEVTRSVSDAGLLLMLWGRARVFRGSLLSEYSLCSWRIDSSWPVVEALGAKRCWELLASRCHCRCHIWGDEGHPSVLVCDLRGWETRETAKSRDGVFEIASRASQDGGALPLSAAPSFILPPSFCSLPTGELGLLEWRRRTFGRGLCERTGIARGDASLNQSLDLSLLLFSF